MLLDNSGVIKKIDNRNRKCWLLKCDNCENEFYRPARFSKKLLHFCSVKCFGIYNRKTISLKCDNCGKEFGRKASRNRSKHGFNFCSRLCKDTAQRIGGINKIQPDHYGKSNGVYNYRERALFEFGEKCEHCGYNKYVELLDVHHIDGDRSNNLIDNLIVLCVMCHASVTRNLLKIIGRELVDI